LTAGLRTIAHGLLNCNFAFVLQTGATMYPLPASKSQATDDDPARVVGRRSAARLRLSIPARLIALNGTFRCILVNLSRTGAQVGLEHPLKNGDGAILQVAGIDHFAVVMRSERGSFGGVNGLEFEEPLSDDDVLATRRFAESFEMNERITLLREVEAWVTGIK